MRGSWWLSCFTTFTRSGLARKQRSSQACWIVQEHTTGSQEQETETFWEAASVEPNTGGTGSLFWDRSPGKYSGRAVPEETSGAPCVRFDRSSFPESFCFLL